MLKSDPSIAQKQRPRTAAQVTHPKTSTLRPPSNDFRPMSAPAPPKPITIRPKSAVASPKVALLLEERSKSRPRTATSQKQLRLRLVSSASQSRRVYFSDSENSKEYGSTGHKSRKLEPQRYIRPRTAPFERTVFFQRSLSNEDESLPDTECIKSRLEDYCIRYDVQPDIQMNSQRLNECTFTLPWHPKDMLHLCQNSDDILKSISLTRKAAAEKLIAFFLGIKPRKYYLGFLCKKEACYTFVKYWTIRKARQSITRRMEERTKRLIKKCVSIQSKLLYNWNQLQNQKKTIIHLPSGSSEEDQWGRLMDLQNPNNEVIYIEFKQDEASNPSFEAVDRLFDLEKLKSSGRLKILWVDRTYGPDVGLAMTLMASPVQLKILHGWIKGSTCLLVPFHPCGPDFELSCVLNVPMLYSLFEPNLDNLYPRAIPPAAVHCDTTSLSTVVHVFGFLTPNSILNFLGSSEKLGESIEGPQSLFFPQRSLNVHKTEPFLSDVAKSLFQLKVWGYLTFTFTQKAKGEWLLSEIKAGITDPFVAFRNYQLLSGTQYDTREHRLLFDKSESRLYRKRYMNQIPGQYLQQSHESVCELEPRVGLVLDFSFSTFTPDDVPLFLVICSQEIPFDYQHRLGLEPLPNRRGTPKWVCVQKGWDELGVKVLESLALLDARCHILATEPTDLHLRFSELARSLLEYLLRESTDAHQRKARDTGLRHLKDMETFPKQAQAHIMDQTLNAMFFRDPFTKSILKESIPSLTLRKDCQDVYGRERAEGHQFSQRMASRPKIPRGFPPAQYVAYLEFLEDKGLPVSSPNSMESVVILRVNNEGT